MKVTNAYQDRIVVQFGDHTHTLTVEQLAQLVRQAYWRMDYRSGSYLARIIAAALIEPPVEASEDTRRSFRLTGQGDITQALARQIREHNPPVGRVSLPEQEEPESVENEKEAQPEPESEAR